MAPLKPLASGFDGLARVYRTLEFLAFGSDLERARFCFLDRLRDCREILLLGEGDGRCLARLVRTAPWARIHCIDGSAAMLARAAARLSGTEAASRVTFEQADVLTKAFPTARYDAVTTLFVLDCFSSGQTAAIVNGVRASLRDGARWLFVDFAEPPRGLPRATARAWLTLLYAFFRWQTGLSATSLPPSEAILRQAGFDPVAQRDFRRGFVRSVLFTRLDRDVSVFDDESHIKYVKNSSLDSVRPPLRRNEPCTTCGLAPTN
jgi:ubiquinone/menaquinone biosynthesis C-methylase UbiE